MNHTDTGSFHNEATADSDKDITTSGVKNDNLDQSMDSVLSVSGDICEDRASVVTLKNVTSDICSEGDGAICDSSGDIPREDGDTCITSRDIFDDDQITLTIDSNSTMDISKLPSHIIEEQVQCTTTCTCTLYIRTNTCTVA